MNTATELLETLRGLLTSTDAESLRIELDEEMGMWGVWLDSCDDLIGAAQSRTEAIDAAIATVRGWK